ncbi:MAG: hypothetical protein AABX97_03240, partial [Candidatus Thermoplasmatota archaeon]
ALLAEQCVEPPIGALLGPAGRRFLAEVELPTVTRGRVDAALRLVDAITQEIALLDRELRTAFRGEARVRPLLPIPGIGFLYRLRRARLGRGDRPLRLARPAVLVGRPHPDRALERCAHPPRAHLQARLAL